MEFAFAGFFFLFALMAGLVGFAFWVWTLVDAVRRSDDEFAVVGQNKLMWVLLIVLAGIIGSILYVAIARPKFGPPGYAR
jgi:hypothetical protein